MPAPTQTDILTLNVNGALTATGALTLAGSNATVGPVALNVNSSAVSVGSIATSGAVTLNIAGSSTFASTGALNQTGGTLSFSIANGSSATFAGINVSGNGSIGGTINGSFTTSSYITDPLKDTANLTISATATNVNLGNVDLQHSSASPFFSVSPGIHINGGACTTVTMGNVQIGTGATGSNLNLGALLEVSGGSVTVSGSFNEGQGAFRTSSVVVNGGTLLDTNTAGLIVGQSNDPNGAGSAGFSVVGKGMATLEKITLGGVTPGTPSLLFGSINSGSLTVSGGKLYVGSGGITGTIAAASLTFYGSNYGISLNGGTIGAKASWSSAANMSLSVATQGPTFQTADASANPFDISLSGILSGPGPLSKTGGGNLTLGASDTYSGPTTINAGALLVNNALTASAVTVNPGGSLGGVGTITLGVIDGGTVNPGSSGAGSIGNLTLVGGITFSDNSTYGVDVNARSSDRLLVTGNFALGNNDTLALNILDGTTSGVYTIATYTGTESGTFANLPANASVDYTTGNAITLRIGAAAPEPASLSLLALGAGGLIKSRRSRRRSNS